MRELDEILTQIPRVTLGTFPTPLHRLHRMEEKLGAATIYIKRDDLTGLGPGGNKIRSLEYLLGDAMEQGCKTVLASGPVQSNLCTLTAAAAAKLGIDCALVHNGARPARLDGNLLLNELLGATSHFIGAVTAEERAAFVEQLFRSCTEEQRNPYIIKNGATTGRGALGYVSAIAELKTQCRAQQIDEMTIFAPGGNGGVAAGLIYGNALMGAPFRIVIISVEDDKATLTAHIAKTIAEIEEITGLPFSGTVEQSAEIVETYRGGGWGVNTEESANAVYEFARLEGILVENVYTSKVLVGMSDWILKKKVQGKVCYLHTGGFGSLFSQYE